MNARSAPHALALVLALLLAACAPPSPAGSGPSADASATGVPSLTSCSPIDLRTPSGSRLDLTGMWHGRGAIHYVRQLGTCVWWIALSDIPGEDAGSAFSIMFHGRIHQDFTVVGDRAFVIKPARPDAPPIAVEHVTFSIEVDEAGGEEVLTMQGPGATSNTGTIVDFYAAISLQRVGPLPVGQ